VVAPTRPLPVIEAVGGSIGATDVARLGLLHTKGVSLLSRQNTTKLGLTLLLLSIVPVVNKLRTSATVSREALRREDLKSLIVLTVVDLNSNDTSDVLIGTLNSSRDVLLSINSIKELREVIEPLGLGATDALEERGDLHSEVLEKTVTDQLLGVGHSKGPSLLEVLESALVGVAEKSKVTSGDGRGSKGHGLLEESARGLNEAVLSGDDTEVEEVEPSSTVRLDGVKENLTPLIRDLVGLGAVTESLRREGTVNEKLVPGADLPVLGVVGEDGTLGHGRGLAELGAKLLVETTPGHTLEEDISVLGSNLSVLLEESLHFHPPS